MRIDLMISFRSERLHNIEVENRILLDKMNKILKGSNRLDNERKAFKANTLHGVQRKKELKRITEENMRILERIQGLEPYYNHLEWDKEAKKNKKLVKNISHYDYNGFKEKRGTGIDRGNRLTPIGLESNNERFGMQTPTESKHSSDYRRKGHNKAKRRRKKKGKSKKSKKGKKKKESVEDVEVEL
eukprot:TRINITY_DN1930_c0_g1_i3.p1 TRINITY_DN1930_c0_g1~~TRINITY_DN1930_c0_g1_i3.p1  ORF type:complete len:186 (+),score=62.46 TRINITY_DN1930_c0_g1_i3:37-594(+)